jgi:hypothetical protein
MINILSKVPGRRTLRRALIAVALTAALAAGFAAGVVYAADPRLDLAFDALLKAEALLLASDAGVVSDKVRHEFEKHVERAVLRVQDAMDAIIAAKNAVDNP